MYRPWIKKDEDTRQEQLRPDKGGGTSKPGVGVGGSWEHPKRFGRSPGPGIDPRKWHGKLVSFVLGKAHGTSAHMAREEERSNSPGDVPGRGGWGSPDAFSMGRLLA